MDQSRCYIEKEKRERRMRDFDLRRKGWTQEQINAMDCDKAVVEAAARSKYKQRLLKKLQTNSISSRPMAKEELDAEQRAYDALGVSREDQAELVRIFGLKPEPEPGRGFNL
jgi:hypothetical protein